MYYNISGKYYNKQKIFQDHFVILKVELDDFFYIFYILYNMILLIILHIKILK